MVVCLIREGKEVGAPAIPFTIGTSVVIREFLKVSDNLYGIVVQGERTVQNKIYYAHEQPHIMAEIEWLDGEVPDYPGDYSILRNIIIDYVKGKSEIPDDNNKLFGMLG